VKRRIGVALLCSLALVVTSVVVVAQDGGAKDGDKPAAGAADRPRSRAARLVKPWSDLTTLTAEQKDQIMRIHADAVDRINEIRDKEEADILALLTPEQHKELEGLMERQKAEQKARRTAAKADEKERDKSGEPKDK
jgi:Spy/CpxP family protein refolding chaperone